VDADYNAFSHREAELLLFSNAVTPNPEAYQSVSEHMAHMLAEIQSDLTGGVYLNFLEGPEARQKAQQGFSADKLTRLKEIKARFDPNNLFRSGHKF